MTRHLREMRRRNAESSQIGRRVGFMTNQVQPNALERSSSEIMRSESVYPFSRLPFCCTFFLLVVGSCSVIRRTSIVISAISDISGSEGAKRDDLLWSR